MEIKKAAFVLADCLAKVTTLFDQNAKAKGLYLRTEVESDVVPLLRADEMRIIQILSNLVANAIKFTDSGGVTIKVSQTTAEVGFLIKIEVIDTGIGIDKGAITSLFESFNQLDSSSTKSYGGTGLGLAISKNLAEMMGGEMGVESFEHVGSNFWFSFLCKEAKQKDRPSPQIVDDEYFRFSNPPKVLLVDDNSTNRKVGSELLSTFNTKVQTAFDGFEAVRMAEKRQYDLILMDIQMPRMDGTEATRLIKAQGHNLSTPIIAMTAYSMKEIGTSI
jgi:CheY-like chemotaxis protein/anti-sigma regulatory factor (Ser/Thr protein kinase)